MKHSAAHGPDETDPENCELCASHGGPFELPEYETTVFVDADHLHARLVPVDDGDEDYEPSEAEGSGSLSEEDFDEDY